MGWTTTKVPKYYTRQQFMDSLFKYDTDKASSEIIERSVYGDPPNRSDEGYYYALIKHVDKETGKTTHYLACCLITYDSVADPEYPFGYKLMEDAMGPYMPAPPPKWLVELADKLAPCTPEYDRSGYAAPLRAAWKEGKSRD